MIQMRWIPGAWRSYTVFDAPHLWSLTRINKKPLRTTSKIHWKIWKSMHVVFAHFPSQSAQLLPGDPTNLTTHRSRRTDLAWLWSLVEICTSRTWRKAFRHRRKPWLLARGLGGVFSGELAQSGWKGGKDEMNSWKNGVEILEKYDQVFLPKNDECSLQGGVVFCITSAPTQDFP